MARRTYSEIFIDKLTEMSEKGKNLVGNGSLREALGWDDDRYDRIKWQLKDEDSIILGRGRGGSVGLADTPDSGVSIFLSYCHADEELKDELVRHLEPLRRMGWVDVWTDRAIEPGADWEGEISQKLASADLILLLVSIDFINSSYCYDIEMDKALEMHDEDEARVVPIILRSCLWQHTPFAKLQVLPKDAKAVVAWPDRDEALTEVAAGIRQVVEEIRTDADRSG